MVLLMDTTHNKLKRFLLTGQHLDYLRIILPLDVTVIDETTAAVTLPHGKKIQLVFLKDKLSMAGRVKVCGKCWPRGYKQYLSLKIELSWVWS
jgi:hypothetical protein